MPEHLITSPVQAEVCIRCGGTIFRGHTGGLDTKVNPTPLDYRTELDTLRKGQRTYDLVPKGHPCRFYLEHRGAIRIEQGYPHTVVGQHHCERRTGNRTHKPSDPVPIVIRAERVAPETPPF